MNSLFSKEIIKPILIRGLIYATVTGVVFAYKGYLKKSRNNLDRHEIIIRDLDSKNWRDGEFEVIDPDCVVTTFSTQKNVTIPGAEEYEIRLSPQKIGVFFVLISFSDPEKKRWDLYRVDVDEDLNYKIEVKKDLTEPCDMYYGIPCSKALLSLKGRSYIDDIPEDLSLMKQKKYLCNDGNTRTIYFSDEGYIYSMDFDLGLLKQCMRVEKIPGTDDNNLCYKFVPDEWCDVEEVLKIEGVN
ncbi:MAG: hypothetical protein K6C99_04810 [Lachnospiraceae bacterium]|nr:hypothetical protein [Lachnospiraceae bacterium]